MMRIMITWKCDQLSRLWRRNKQTAMKFNESFHQERGPNKRSQLNGFIGWQGLALEASLSLIKKNVFLHHVAGLISNKLNGHPFISHLVFFVGCDLECLPIKLPTLWQVSLSASGSWCTKIMNQLLPLPMIQRYDNSGLSLFAWETVKPPGSDCRL